MDERPQIHEPALVQPIPKGELWSSLLLPPFLTVAINLVVGVAYSKDAWGAILVFAPCFDIFVIIVGTTIFSRVVGKRYRGRSRMFLSAFYFMGQIVVCSALWFGSCILVVS